MLSPFIIFVISTVLIPWIKRFYSSYISFFSLPTNTDKSGHLAWCALVALQLARQDGLISSESQENLFITRWFALAKKQRRFSRDLATDIDWILNQGRQLGIRAKLASKLNYLWLSCTGELSEQNDLFRLTHALETAKGMSWNYRLLSDREWSGRNAVGGSASVNGIYLSRTNLDVAFDDSGRQVNPVMARLTGNLAGVIKLLNRCSWQVEPETSLPHHYSLMAGQGVPGKGN
ncbi:DUF2913 family protein [Klebsiella pneumoniae]|nr:DUF2913 family protein [Escherichia coli]EIX9792441.1 DUF2913 family protein [Klebsiella pneumoniae]HBC8790904.1 DUF2913 family protein [Citrobacter braakii]HAX2580308.1 DUF2913 family protein [Escherichia coli]HAY0298224.1 DUF2913 family protein [Escherichia coli]